MMKYDFTVILAGSPELTDDVCDNLYAAGCDDSSPSSGCGITRIVFHREADSLESAIRSAIGQIQSIGLRAERVEIDALADLLKV
jgi:hypothetical protein